MSLAQRIQAECVAIATDAAALSAACATRATTPAPAALRDQAGGLIARVADVRERLDAVDLSGVYPNTADGVTSILAAGLWERGTRSRLTALRGALSDLQRAADAQVTAGSRTLQTHVVAVGDTLQSIAQARLGDWRQWTRLVDANDIDPAEPLTVGALLAIPARERGA